MCFDSFLFFRITDKLLPFDLLSIVILDQLCMNLLCLYRYFFFFSVTLLQHTTWKNIYMGVWLSVMLESFFILIAYVY